MLALDERIMTNLIEGILNECNRVREIIPHYEAIGPAGNFGAAMLRACIKEGEQAMASGDVVRMVHAYKSLQECKE